MTEATPNTQGSQEQPTQCFQCGRDYRAHCPDCGSYRGYALVSKTDVVTRADGKRELLRVYRCTRCGAVYNDDDWRLRCHAAPQKLGRPAAREPETHFKSLSDAPEVMQDALARMLQMRKERGE